MSRRQRDRGVTEARQEALVAEVIRRWRREKWLNADLRDTQERLEDIIEHGWHGLDGMDRIELTREYVECYLADAVSAVHEAAYHLTNGGTEYGRDELWKYVVAHASLTIPDVRE